MYNGIVGGSPPMFNLTASVVYPVNPCSSFEAGGKIVILQHGGACPIGKRIDITIKAGAAAIMIDMAEMIKIGRFANIPLVPLPIKIPVVTFGRNGRLALESLGVFNPTSDPDPRNPPPRGPNRPPNNRVQQAEVVLQLVPGKIRRIF
jgi:hypothetical protein